jgi:hypothetical protein
MGNSTFRSTPLRVSSGELSGNIVNIIPFLHGIGNLVYVVDNTEYTYKHHCAVNKDNAEIIREIVQESRHLFLTTEVNSCRIQRYSGTAITRQKLSSLLRNSKRLAAKAAKARWRI